MNNQLDILITVGGLFLAGYGSFCMIITQVRVGFRGMHKLFLFGSEAKALGIVYVIGGFSIAVASLISWLGVTSISRLYLLGFCVFAGTSVFLSHLIGSVVAEIRYNRKGGD